MNPFEDTIRDWVKSGIVSPELERELHMVQDRYLDMIRSISEHWHSELALYNPYKIFAQEYADYSRERIKDLAQSIARGTATDSDRREYRRRVAMDMGGASQSEENIRHAKAVPFEKVLARDGRHVVRGKLRCPFHEERTPSCNIHRRSNRLKCFGCGWAGDTIQYVIERKNVKFIEAINYLLNI